MPLKLKLCTLIYLVINYNISNICHKKSYTILYTIIQYTYFDLELFFQSLPYRVSICFIVLLINKRCYLDNLNNYITQAFTGFSRGFSRINYNHICLIKDI